MVELAAGSSDLESEEIDTWAAAFPWWCAPTAAWTCQQDQLATEHVHDWAGEYRNASRRRSRYARPLKG